MSTQEQKNARTRGRRAPSAAARPPGHARAPVSGSGFTLVESLITIGLAGLLLAVYTAMLTSTFFLRRSQYNIQAANFIQEELDTLRGLEFDDLLNRTNGNFLGVARQRGKWTVADAGGDKVLRLGTTAPAVVGETGLALLPGNYREDFTFSAEVKADPSSPVGWDAGIAFRYRDAENHYRFRFSAGGIALDKVFRGTVTTVWSQSASYSTGTPYLLEITASGNQFTLKKDGSTIGTPTDNTFLEGDLALFSGDGAVVSFDDVTVNVPTAQTWDFESESAGAYPADWKRLSPVDLPGGAGTLTIENYLGQTTLKKVTVTVSWSDAGVTRSNSGSTIIAK